MVGSMRFSASRGFRYFDLQVLKGRPYVTGLFEVFFGLDNKLLHARQISFCNGLLDGRAVEYMCHRF
jgi:hypothetical protein